MTIIKKLQDIFKKNNYVDSQVIYKNAASKYSITAECTMELSGQTEEKKKEINDYLNKLIKKYIETPEKLIQYMRLKGSKIYEINNADNILALFNEEEGFITPQKGLKAIFLTFLLSTLGEGRAKVNYSMPEIFVFNKKNTEIYTIARALHKYYGFINNFPGFDSKSQAIFKKIYGKKNLKNTNERLNNLPLKDVIACRSALARDLDSINFTLKLSLEYEQSKKALKKLITDKNANI